MRFALNFKFFVAKKSTFFIKKEDKFELRCKIIANFILIKVVEI